MPSRNRNRPIGIGDFMMAARQLRPKRKGADGNLAESRRRIIRVHLFTVHGMKANEKITQEGLKYLSEKIGGLSINVPIIKRAFQNRGKPLPVLPIGDKVALARWKETHMTEYRVITNDPKPQP